MSSVEGATATLGLEASNFEGLGAALSTIHEEARARVGQEDLRRLERLNWFSRGMEGLGRVLLHLSVEPFMFAGGVFCLFVHKQLQMTTIGHTVLHGTYDHIEGAGRFRSSSFCWDTPIDEESWRAAHNIQHHQYTNVARRDLDINFGGIRLTEQTPHRLEHYWQVPVMFLVSWPFFSFTINLHVTGMLDLMGSQGWSDSYDVLRDDSPEAAREVRWRTWRKLVPYFLKEYVLFPLLAGPGFAKVLLGNFLSSRLRDLYTAATVYCGHVGASVESFPPGTRAGSRGRWYAMQIASSNNFRASLPLQVLCGGLEHQIEHHLFPKLPPHRLREIAPHVEQVCLEHGLPYRSRPWMQTLRDAIARIAVLSMPADAPRASLIGRIRRVMEDMA